MSTNRLRRAEMPFCMLIMNVVFMLFLMTRQSRAG